VFSEKAVKKLIMINCIKDIVLKIFHIYKKTMTSIFNSTTIQFEQSPIIVGDTSNSNSNINSKNNIRNPLNNDFTFGILKLNSVKVESFPIMYEFIFTIDRSGSMSDACADGRSKQQHILHTLKNMIWYFHDNPTIRVRVSVFTFDTVVELIVDRVFITKANIHQIIQKLEIIRPKDCTNIGSAIQTVTEFATKIKASYSSDLEKYEISHIFMTDGDATEGVLDSSILKTFIDNSYTNIFVGFGIDHNSAILCDLSSDSNSAYYFIDKLENSGFVYGEILHSILFRILKNTVLAIENGLLYNFKTDSWTTHLYIENIIGESEKIYHVISNNVTTCKVTLSGHVVENDSPFLLEINKVELVSSLTSFIFRHKTLQLLYDVTQYSKRNSTSRFANNPIIRLHDDDDNNNNINNINNDLKKNLRDRMTDLMTEIKLYMTTFQLVDDPVLKQLCDDIYISYRTFGTEYCNMFTTARHTSHGTHRCYNISATPDYGDFSDDNDNNIFQTHTLSLGEDTPYTSPRALEIMRTVSDGSAENNDNVFDFTRLSLEFDKF